MKLQRKILLGLALGAAAGIGANAIGPDTPVVHAVSKYLAAPIGQIFLRFLLMTVIPLVFSSLVLGVMGLGNIRDVGRVGVRTLLYFLLSTTVATVIGLTLVNLVRPGSSVTTATRTELVEAFRAETEAIEARGVTLGVDLLVNVVPRNPVRAAADMDMLAVILFSLVFGLALSIVPEERGRPMRDFVVALGEVVMRIIDFAMRLAPIGVFGLIFVVTSRFGWDILQQLGVYAAIVLVGLILHAVLGLSSFVFLIGRRSPLWFWKESRASLITAFSTSSSSATLPTSIRVAETQLKVSPQIAGFVLPLGATMNMNGTALYEGVTVLFLAQIFGVDLALGQQIIVVVMSVITAIGVAGVPGGSLPLLMVVLATVGVPAEGIAIILGIDRVLDMCRTTLNVAGDLSAAVVLDRFERPVGHQPV